MSALTHRKPPRRPTRGLTAYHELRTPLTSILGYLERILDEPGHEEIEAELLIVHRNATHLLGLVNDLIAVASERVELSQQEADLALLLAASLIPRPPRRRIADMNCLGPPISKTIIEGHVGSLSLISSPGVGTTATFILPVP